MVDNRLGKVRFKALQVLMLAHELKSLRAVAEAVNTSQPAVTQMLQELERTLGQTLLVRDRRGVALTSAGQVVADRARVALAEMSAAADSLKGSKETPILRVGTLPVLMLNFLPEAIQQLMAMDATPMRLRIHESTVPSLRERLLADEDDVVLTGLAAVDPGAKAFHAIRVHRLATETLALFVGQRHPLYEIARNGRSVDAAQLAHCSWTLPPDGTELRRYVENLLVFQCGLAPPSPTVEVSSLNGCMTMVGATCLVGVAPLSAVERMAETLKLAPLRLGKIKSATFRDTVVMFHARQDQNPLIPLFLSAVKKVQYRA